MTIFFDSETYKQPSPLEYDDLRDGSPMKELYNIFLYSNKEIPILFDELNEKTNSSNIPEHVKKVKLNDYGHGNAHSAEVMNYAKILSNNVSALSNRTEHDTNFHTADSYDKEFFDAVICAAFIHDDALCYGLSKEDQDDHENIVFEKVYTSHEKLAFHLINSGLCEDPSEKFLNTVEYLVRNHREPPADITKTLNYNIDKRFFSTLSVLDKVAELNPISIRQRFWSSKYSLNKSIDNLSARFINTHNEDTVKFILSYIFGIEGSLAIWNFFQRVIYVPNSSQQIKWVNHIDFIRG